VLPSVLGAAAGARKFEWLHSRLFSSRSPFFLSSLLFFSFSYFSSLPFSSPLAVFVSRTETCTRVRGYEANSHEIPTHTASGPSSLLLLLLCDASDPRPASGAVSHDESSSSSLPSTTTMRDRRGDRRRRGGG